MSTCCPVQFLFWNADVLGMVKFIGQLQEIVSVKMNGKTLHKRDLLLWDDSCAEIRLTLWNERAQSDQYGAWMGHVVAFRGAKVGDYQGKNLTTTAATQVILDPDIVQGRALFDWSNQVAESISRGEKTPIITSLSGMGSGGVQSCIFSI